MTAQNASRVIVSLPRSLTKARLEALDELRSHANDAGSPLLLDGSDVHAVDSSGIEALTELFAALEAAGHAPLLRSPSACLAEARSSLRLELILPLEGESAVTQSRWRGERIGAILVGLGLARPEEVEEAAATAGEDGMLLGDKLLETGCVEERQFVEALALQIGLPIAAPSENHTLDITLHADMPLAVLRRYGVLPFLRHGSTLAVATRDPSNIYALDEIRRLSGLTLLPCVTTRVELERGLDLLQRAGAGDGGDWEDELDTDVRERVDDLLRNAAIEGASDLHIEPTESEWQVRFRVDGRLRPSRNFALEDGAALVARLKVMAECDISERRTPQDGRFSFGVPGRTIDVRLSTLPTVHGEKVVMRLLDRSSAHLELATLGFSETNLGRLRHAAAQPHGLILVTGPTGSGKTTTLYSLLDEIADPEVNVSTVENPVEYTLDGINQVQVNPKAGLTFASALRSLLRQDPDIVMIGEIRDGETAHIAIEAALTGHLVLATIHTNDAASAPTRLVQMGVEPYLVGATLNAVVAQRLVRRVCESCNRREAVAPELLRRYEEHGLVESEVAHTVGCEACGGRGYTGRTGVHEVMTIGSELRNLIGTNPSTSEVEDAARRGGMNSLLQDALRLVNERVTTLEEALRVGGQA